MFASASRFAPPGAVCRSTATRMPRAAARGRISRSMRSRFKSSQRKYAAMSRMLKVAELSLTIWKRTRDTPHSASVSNAFAEIGCGGSITPRRGMPPEPQHGARKSTTRNDARSKTWRPEGFSTPTATVIVSSSSPSFRHQTRVASALAGTAFVAVAAFAHFVGRMCVAPPRSFTVASKRTRHGGSLVARSSGSRSRRNPTVIQKSRRPRIGTSAVAPENPSRRSPGGTSMTRMPWRISALPAGVQSGWGDWASSVAARPVAHDNPTAARMVAAAAMRFMLRLSYRSEITVASTGDR